MNEFTKMILHELEEGIWQAIFTAFIVGIVIVAAYRVRCAENGMKSRFPWRESVLSVLLAGYLSVLFYATVFRLGGMGASGTSFRLFRAWREAWNTFSATSWANVFLNIALLIPFGILMPLRFPQFRKWPVMLISTIGISLFVEIVQYLNGCGIFDIDDLLTNTLGGMIGYFFLMTILSARNRKKCWLVYAILTLLPIVAIGSIVVAYRCQEYGNLPGAYTYQVDTTGLTWKVDCSLSDESSVVPIYQTNVPTQEDAETLRDRFSEILGEDFQRVDYYDESIQFMNQLHDGPCAHFLRVDRFDGSYRLSWAYPEELSPARADRETIEELLHDYSIYVPDGSDFSYLHSGIHVFTVDHVADGSEIVDGMLSCVYNEGGLLSEIHNSLVHYTRCAETEILSERAAYEQLCEGWFLDATGLISKAKEITVTSCTLSRQMDTKGFSQPVYLFGLSTDLEKYETIMIPARVTISR